MLLHCRNDVNKKGARFLPDLKVEVSALNLEETIYLTEVEWLISLSHVSLRLMSFSQY